MKKVLIVVAVGFNKPDHASWLSLRDALRNEVDSQVTVDMTSFNNLVFDISNDKAIIIDMLSAKDVAEYDAVIIRNVGKTIELGITLANYLAFKHIPFTDNYLETKGAGKLACAMLRLRYDLSTPRTICATAKYLVDYIGTGNFTYPFILKADKSRKGRDNYLIKSKDELGKRLSEQPEVTFIAQQFIENDGDYRALVMGDKISVVIKRIAASKETHINNTSQGGVAELVAVDEFSAKIQEEILKAARIEKVDVAGVDIIFDKFSGKHYFLEVNEAPQVGSGTFMDEKIHSYADFIKSMV